VVELADSDRLPVFKVVAMRTVRRQPAFMFVLMARDAGLGKPEKGLVQVFGPNCSSLRCRNLVGRVAAIAGEPCVLSFQGIAGLFVVECFGVPLDQRKIFAVMFGVATCTILAGARLDVISGM